MVAATTAVIALAIAAVLWWKKKTPKLVAILTLVAGGGITTGLLGEWLSNMVGWAGGLVGALTSQAVGVAVPMLAALVLLLIYAIEMWPNKGKATTRTAVIGLMLPAVAAGIPGPAGTAVVSAITTVGAGVGSGVTALFGGA